MKKTTIKFEYSEEKLLALTSYMEKKDTDLDTELEDVIEKLYEKFVPSQVREFIDAKEEQSKRKVKKDKPKVNGVENVNQKEVDKEPNKETATN